MSRHDRARRYALTNHLSDSARTYVACRGARVVGFYSLAVGSVLHADAPGRVTKRQPRHPVPVMIVARLAVDGSEQGTELEKALLKDALLRTAQAADLAGSRNDSDRIATKNTKSTKSACLRRFPPACKGDRWVCPSSRPGL